MPSARLKLGSFPDDDLARTERLDEETEFLKEPLVGRHEVRLRIVDREKIGNEDRLSPYAARCQFGEDALEVDALMSDMLVDDHQAGRSIRDDVGILNLTEDPWRSARNELPLRVHGGKCI